MYHQPSSPLATTTYPNAQPASLPHHALKTPSKQLPFDHDVSGPTPARSIAFPPDLGSSSPPISSPTSYREHPSFNTDVSSARASDRSRVRSSAGLFAARARASLIPARASSSAGSVGGGNSMAGEGLRYGPRPGLRKAVTGFFGGETMSGSVTTTTTTTGYALHRPLPSKHHSERLTTTTHILPGPTAPFASGDSIQGSMWKGKFRKRCLAVSQKREDKDRRRRSGGGRELQERDSLEPGDAMGESGSDAEAEAEAEHEEIFRRMIQKEQRKIAHSMALSYDQQVGGSDPAIWEADVRDAEREATELTNALPPPSDHGGTPDRHASQWQYRSATKPTFGTNGNAPEGPHGASEDPLDDDDDDDARQRAEDERLAQFLLEQEDEENARLQAYAAFVAPPPPLASVDRGEEDGPADTPGGVLGVEMEGFTWEDAPLSDDYGDVEMA